MLDLRQEPDVLAFISQVYDTSDDDECSTRFVLSILVCDLRLPESLPLLDSFVIEPSLEPELLSNEWGETREQVIARRKECEERKAQQVVGGITRLAEDGSAAAERALLKFVNHRFETVRRAAIMGYLNLCDDFELHVADLYQVANSDNRHLVDLYSERRRDAGKVSRCGEDEAR